MDDGASHAVHHTTQRKCCFPRRFAFVASPTGYLAQELGTHRGAAIVGRAKFIGEIIRLGPKRAGFERNDFQACLGENRATTEPTVPAPISRISTSAAGGKVPR